MASAQTADFNYLHRTVTLTDASATALNLGTGLSVQLFSQYEDARDNKGNPLKMRRGARLLLSGGVGSDTLKDVFALDMELGKDGRIANLPESIALTSSQQMGWVSNADPEGLSLYGGLIAGAQTKNTPSLLDSGDGRVHVYFRGADDRFLCAQLETDVSRARYCTNLDKGRLVFSARAAGSLRNNSFIGIDPGDLASCHLTVDKSVSDDLDELPFNDGGNAVDFDEDWALLGDSANNKAVVYRRQGGSWQRFKELTENSSTSYGSAVACSDGFLAVADSGADKVWLYRTGDVITRLVNPLTGSGGFGTTLSADGDLLAVGAPTGAHTDTLKLLTDISGEKILAQPVNSGTTLSVDAVNTGLLASGETAADYCAITITSGSQSESWEKVPRAAASLTAILGGTDSTYDYANLAVAVGTTQAPGPDSGGSQLLTIEQNGATGQVANVAAASTAGGLPATPGALHIFRLSDQQQIQVLFGSNASEGFGSAAAIQGDMLIVGSPNSNSATGSVAAYQKSVGGQLYRSIGKIVPPTAPATGNRYGAAVDVRGPYALMGSPGAGKATLMSRDSANNWTLVKELTPQTTESDFGTSVALSGNALGGKRGARADFAAIGSPAANKLHIYYRHHNGTNQWGEKHTVTASLGTGLGNCLAGTTSLVISATNSRLGIYNLATMNEYWSNLPGQLDHFLNVINGTATDDPTDLDVGKGNKTFYDYENTHFIYGIGLQENGTTPPEDNGRMRFISRYIKGSAADLSPVSPSIIDDRSGVTVSCTRGSDNKLTLTFTAPIVYRLYKTELSENKTAISITETWPGLPDEAYKIAKILNGSGQLWFSYDDATSTDSQVFNLSSGSALFTAAIDGCGYSLTAALKTATATEYTEGLTPPRSSLPRGCALYTAGTERVPTDEFKTMSVGKVSTICPLVKPGEGGGWQEEPPNYALRLGSTDTAVFQTSTSLNLEQDLTFETWVNPDSENLTGRILEYSCGDKATYGVGLLDGQVYGFKQLEDQSKCEISSGASLPANTWSHVSAGYQSSYAIKLEKAKQHYVDCGNNEMFNLDKGICLEAWVRNLEDDANMVGTIISKWGEPIYADDDSGGKSWKLSINGERKPELTLNTKSGYLIATGNDPLPATGTSHITAMLDFKERQVQALAFNANRNTHILADVDTDACLQYSGSTVRLYTDRSLNYREYEQAWPNYRITTFLQYCFEFWIKPTQLSSDLRFSFNNLSLILKTNGQFRLETVEVQTRLVRRSYRVKVWWHWETRWHWVWETYNHTYYTNINHGLTMNAWNHVALNLDLNMTELYINGTRMFRERVGSPGYGRTNLTISGNAQARIGDIRMWNYRRTADQIKDNMNVIPDEASRHLAALWPLWGYSTNRTSNNDGNVGNNTWVNDDKPPVDASNILSLVPTNSDMTIEFWAKREATTEEWLVTQGTSSPNDGLHLGWRTTGFAFAFYANDYNTTFTGTDGKWHHYSCVCESGVKKVYIDGLEVNEYVGASASNSAGSGAQYQGVGVLNIGRRYDGQAHFTGSMHGLRVWNKARTVQDIRDDMNQRLTGSEQGLILYLPLDDGGTSVKNLAKDRKRFDIVDTGTMPQYDTVELGMFGVKLHVNGAIQQITMANTGGPGVAAFQQPAHDYIKQVINKSDRDMFKIKASDTAVQIGRDAAKNAPNYFNGLVAEARVWQRGLYPWEVTEFADHRLSGREVGLVANWQLNEGKGKMAYDARNQSHGIIQALDEIVDSLWVPDAGRARWWFFVNGELQGNQPHHLADDDTLLTDDSYRFVMGEGYNGDLDEMRIWKTLRTAEQVDDCMYRPMVGSEYGLVGYWPCNEIINSRVPDRSGLGNEGKLHGSITVIGEGNGEASPVGSEIPQVRNVIGGEASDKHLNTVLATTPVVGEYGDMQMDTEGTLIGVLKRTYIYIDNTGTVEMVTGYKVGDLESTYIGQVQTQPTLVGFIEGAPPVPAENLHDHDGADYNGASSVELIEADNTTTSFTSTVSSNTNISVGVRAGVKINVESLAGLGVMFKTIGVNGELGFTYHYDQNSGWNDTKSFTYDSGVSTNKSLSLTGSPKEIEGLGKRFMPENVGYALVKSGTAEKYAMRLKQRGTAVGYQLLPSPDVPQDWNIIMFKINPRYTKNGTLDGKLGLVNDPDYPLADQQRGSYFKPLEAYALKSRVESEAKELEAHFRQIDTSSGLSDDAGNRGRDTEGAEDNTGYDFNKKMAKRSMVNTYVWTADGGLFAEEENFTGTMEENYGNSYSVTQAFGFNFSLEATFGPVGLYVGLDFDHAATHSAEKSVTASSTANFSMSSTVSPESTPPVDSSGAPKPGFVDGYRFLSFYLRPKRSYFDTFFEKIVDPVWLRTPDPAAQALRSAQSHSNGVWRVMHRTTYVSRIPPILERAPREEEPPLLHKPLNEENNRILIEAILAFTKADGTPAVDPFNPDVSDIGTAIQYLLAITLENHPLDTPANQLIKEKYLPSWTPDVMYSTQAALSLDGTGYVQLASLAGGPTSELTFECWIRAAACSGDQILVSYATPAQAEAFVVSCGSTLKVKVNGSAWFDSGENFRDDQWHHVAVSWRSSDGLLTVFKNGVALTSTGNLATGTVLQNAGHLVLGQHQSAPGAGFDPATGFVGIADEMRFWAESLPQVSLHTWMERPITHGHPQYPSLAAYLVFEGPLGTHDELMPNASPLENATRTASAGCTSGGNSPTYVDAGAPIFNVDLYEELREDVLYYLQRHFVKDE